MAKLLEKNPNDRFDTISDVGRAMFDARATNVFGSKPVVIGAVVVLVLGIAAVLGMSGRVIPNKVALHPGKGTAKLEFSSETPGMCGPCIDDVSVKKIVSDER